MFCILSIGRGALAGDFVLRVTAGEHACVDTPVEVNVAVKDLPPALAQALGGGPLALEFRQTDNGTYATVEAELLAGDDRTEPAARLTWVLAGNTPAGASRAFRFERVLPSKNPSPWSLKLRRDGLLDLKNGERTVFRYNAAPSSHPNYGPIETRDAYIHPAFTPSGALITGDFSRFHPHHRGIFLAYTKTQVGRLHPDFWNIQSGTGKIRFARLESTSTGAVTARFRTHHEWLAGDVLVMRERWDVTAYHIAGQAYWLFDLTATQQAVKDPVELLPYRYGGMAYRGAEPFVKGPIDVLTNEGPGRRERDQKPARWVDLTGPIQDGSTEYAGAMVADHPSNANHPSVARIHPTTLPFFCYVPAHDHQVSITADKPTVFRYRILIHDGHPDGDRNEAIWHDFAEPPRVTWSVGSP